VDKIGRINEPDIPVPIVAGVCLRNLSQEDVELCGCDKVQVFTAMSLALDAELCPPVDDGDDPQMVVGVEVRDENASDLPESVVDRVFLLGRPACASKMPEHLTVVALAHIEQDGAPTGDVE